MKQLLTIFFIIQSFYFVDIHAQIDNPLRRTFISKSLTGTMGTYALPPKLANGKVDNNTLIAQLKELHANTYHWLIEAGNTDLDALKEFLPIAKDNKIKIWITLLPPSESPPLTKQFSEPYRLDFIQWAVVLSKLSLQYDNIVAWSIDDFVHNLKLFTPEYVKTFLDSAKNINPAIAFIPCSYYKQITPEFVKNYGNFLDGILFPYRNESVKADLKDPNQVASEIEKLRMLFDKPVLIFLDIYASSHSQLGATTPEYIAKVLELGLASADGVLIYCHQNPIVNIEKYTIIQKGFKTGLGLKK
jgi:hypothetical protein